MTFENTALLLIDMQKGLQEISYYGSERNNPDAEANATEVLSFFRKKDLPVFHVKHDSTNPESPLFPDKTSNEFIDELRPANSETWYSKNVNSAFIGTPLESELKKRGIKNLVIAGLTTEHCVSTSTRMAANLGFNVTLLSDATAAFDKPSTDGKRMNAELIHTVSIATLKDEFAEIMTSKELLQKA